MMSQDVMVGASGSVDESGSHGKGLYKAKQLVSQELGKKKWQEEATDKMYLSASQTQ